MGSVGEKEELPIGRKDLGEGTNRFRHMEGLSCHPSTEK